LTYKLHTAKEQQASWRWPKTEAGRWRNKHHATSWY